MLSEQNIDDVYAELGTMFVALDPRPEKGLDYIRERLTLCRAMQDRIGELRLRVNHETTDVIQRHMIAQQTQEVQPTPDNKRAIKTLEMEKYRHVTLGKMVAAQAQLLSRTAQDIKLLADITKQQYQRGEIDPKEAEKALIRDVPVGELSGLPDVPSTRQAEPFAPATGGFDGALPGRVEHTPFMFEGLGTTAMPMPSPPDVADVAQGPINTAVAMAPTRQEPEPAPMTGAQLVGFDAALPVTAPDDDRIRLGDQAAVSFDELFAGADHAGTRSPF